MQIIGAAVHPFRHGAPELVRAPFGPTGRSDAPLGASFSDRARPQRRAHAHVRHDPFSVAPRTGKLNYQFLLPIADCSRHVRNHSIINGISRRPEGCVVHRFRAHLGCRILLWRPVLCEKPTRAAAGNRLAKQIALAFLASFTFQRSQFSFRFNTFGRHCEA